MNEGAGDLIVDHIGIDEKFNSCGQKGIELYGLTCGSGMEELRPV